MVSSVPALISSSPLSFLGLPFSVRREIYLFAGLVRSCSIDLNLGNPKRKAEYFSYCHDQLGEEICIGSGPHEHGVVSAYCCSYQAKQVGRTVPFSGPDGIDCVCDPPPLDLLLVCGVIHKEVAAIFYGENRFKICRTAPKGLSALLRFGSEALGAMTSLCIRLNSCGCVPGRICSEGDRYDERPLTGHCEYCHDSCKCGTDLPLAAADPDAPSIISEWKDLNLHLAEHFKPGRINLSMVCDTVDDILHQELLSPMLKLPRLAQCAIRLGQRPDPKIRAVIGSFVYQMIDRTIVSQTIQWDNLPSEIQLQILHDANLRRLYTIEWTEGHHSSMSWCCRQCTDSLEICCCSHNHAAYTSMGCVCGPVLLNYCLVSKSFRQLTLQAFFGLNKFALHSTDPEEPPIGDKKEYQHRHRSVLKFLQFIPPDALQFIRSVEIVFPILSSFDLREHSSSLGDWERTLWFIRDHLHLDLLDLTLRMEPLDNDERVHLEPEEYEQQCYRRMTDPVRRIIKGEARDIRVVFLDTYGDEPREERNRVRERELQTQLTSQLLSASQNLTDGCFWSLDRASS